MPQKTQFDNNIKDLCMTFQQMSIAAHKKGNNELKRVKITRHRNHCRSPPCCQCRRH